MTPNAGNAPITTTNRHERGRRIGGARRTRIPRDHYQRDNDRSELRCQQRRAARRRACRGTRSRRAPSRWATIRWATRRTAPRAESGRREESRRPTRRASASRRRSPRRTRRTRSTAQPPRGPQVRAAASSGPSQPGVTCATPCLTNGDDRARSDPRAEAADPRNADAAGRGGHRRRRRSAHRRELREVRRRHARTRRGDSRPRVGPAVCDRSAAPPLAEHHRGTGGCRCRARSSRSESLTAWPRTPLQPRWPAASSSSS